MDWIKKFKHRIRGMSEYELISDFPMDFGPNVKIDSVKQTVDELLVNISVLPATPAAFINVNFTVGGIDIKDPLPPGAGHGDNISNNE